MEHLGCLQTQRVRACRGVRSKPPLYRRGRPGQDMSCSRHTARRSPGAGRDQASPGLVPPIALEAFGASPTSALSVSSPSVWSPHCAPVPLLPELHPFPRALLRTGPTPAVTAPPAPGFRSRARRSSGLLFTDTPTVRSAVAGGRLGEWPRGLRNTGAGQGAGWQPRLRRGGALQPGTDHRRSGNLSLPICKREAI